MAEAQTHSSVVPSVAGSRLSNSRCSSEPYPGSCGLSSSGPAPPRSSLLNAPTGWVSSSPNKRSIHTSSDNGDVRSCLRRISASFPRHDECDMSVYLFPYGAALHLLMRVAFIVLRGLLSVCLALPPWVPASRRIITEPRASCGALPLSSVDWVVVLAIRLLLVSPS